MVNRKELLSELAGFYATEQYYKVYPTVMLTDGVHFLFKKASSYWIADMVYWFQSLPVVAKEPFQVYELEVNLEKHNANLKVTDGNENVLYTQFIEVTDFCLPTFSFYYTDNVILLPSEY